MKWIIVGGLVGAGLYLWGRNVYKATKVLAASRTPGAVPAYVKKRVGTTSQYQCFDVQTGVQVPFSNCLTAKTTAEAPNPLAPLSNYFTVS